MAAALAQEIRRQVETGATVYDRNTRQPRASGYGDFLILVRRRDATFEEIIRALKSAGVPVAGADRLKLSSHIVFDDLKALARFASSPATTCRWPRCCAAPSATWTRPRSMIWPGARNVRACGAN
ncbi:ATP-dependent helicase/nuclease subunit A [compost metagenome]